MSAARGADAAPIERVSYQHILVASSQDVVAHRQPVLVIELVIDLDKSVVGVGSLEDVEILVRPSDGIGKERGLGQIDDGQVVPESGGEGWRLAAALAFIVH